MKVKIDCEGCERKVKKALDGMKGRLLLPTCLLDLFLFSASYHDLSVAPFLSHPKKQKRKRKSPLSELS